MVCDDRDDLRLRWVCKLDCARRNSGHAGGGDVVEVGYIHSRSSPRVVAGFADGTVGSLGTAAGDARVVVEAR